MRKSIGVFVLTAVAFGGVVAGAGAAEAEGSSLMSADEIVANVNARDDGERVTRKLTMEMIDSRGKTRVRETYGYRRYFGDEKRTVSLTIPSRSKTLGVR